MPRDIKVLFFQTKSGDIDAVLDNATASAAGTTIGIWDRDSMVGTFYIDTDGNAPVVPGTFKSEGTIDGDLTAWIRFMLNFQPTYAPYNRRTVGSDELV